MEQLLVLQNRPRAGAAARDRDRPVAPAGDRRDDRRRRHDSGDLPVRDARDGDRRDASGSDGGEYRGETWNESSWRIRAGWIRLIAIPWLAETVTTRKSSTVTLDIGQGRELADIRERALALGRGPRPRDRRARGVRPRLHRCRRCRPARSTTIARRWRPRWRGRSSPASWWTSRGWSARPPSRTAAARRQRPVCARRARPRARSVDASSSRRHGCGTCRPRAVDLRRAHGIPVPPSPTEPYSTDANVWGRSIASRRLRTRGPSRPRTSYALTRAAADCSRSSRPTSRSSSRRAAGPRQRHRDAAARDDRESRDDRRLARRRPDRHDRQPSGRHKSREIYEAPAAVVLHTAHRELEQLVVAVATSNDRARTSARDLRRSHLQRPWFSQTREAHRRLRRAPCSRASPGTIRLRLFKGDCRVAGRDRRSLNRRSPRPRPRISAPAGLVRPAACLETHA